MIVYQSDPFQNVGAQMEIIIHMSHFSSGLSIKSLSEQELHLSIQQIIAPEKYSLDSRCVSEVGNE